MVALSSKQVYPVPMHFAYVSDGLMEEEQVHLVRLLLFREREAQYIKESKANGSHSKLGV